MEEEEPQRSEAPAEDRAVERAGEDTTSSLPVHINDFVPLRAGKAQPLLVEGTPVKLFPAQITAENVLQYADPVLPYLYSINLRFDCILKY